MNSLFASTRLIYYLWRHLLNLELFWAKNFKIVLSDSVWYDILLRPPFLQLVLNVRLFRFDQVIQAQLSHASRGILKREWRLSIHRSVILRKACNNTYLWQSRYSHFYKYGQYYAARFLRRPHIQRADPVKFLIGGVSKSGKFYNGVLMEICSGVDCWLHDSWSWTCY